MSARTVIPSPQNLVRDCYAPCPSINLTLRSNGEEKVQIMDALGNFYSAGLGAGPTVIPTHANGAAGGSFPAAKYWAYRYVWVAKTLFPKVENAVTGGGSPAPRTNPSPGSAIASGSGNKKTITIGTSIDPKFSHIWIYRTPFVDTSNEALTDSEAGLAFWIGEVANSISATTVTFTDDGSYVAQTEQIENDNFDAPQFSLCVFAEPYFYGIGNQPFVGNVSLGTDGVVTLVPARTPAERWFNGRDGQSIKFNDINAGGYNGLGNFYFKFLTAITAELYSDIALTVRVNPGFIGTTIATIQGNANTLYRSKPHNPLSWGETDSIDDVLVPHLYFFSVSPGSATAIGVLPSVSLLKIDFEGPNACVTLNLRNAGTPSFEPSRRIVSTTYVAGSHFGQFLATIAKGESALWAYDPKTSSIVQCDGAEQIPISSAVFESLRSVSQDNEHFKFIHGNYHPRLELNLLFLNDSRAADTAITFCIYFHAPTQQWGIIDCFSITASGQILNPATGETLLLVGSHEGLLGEFGAPNQFVHWATLAEATPLIASSPESAGGTLLGVNSSMTIGLIGKWITTIIQYHDGTQVVFYGRISDVIATFNLQLDLILDANFATIANLPVWTMVDGDMATTYIGLIEMRVGRFFNAKTPTANKKVEQIWATFIRPADENFGIVPQLLLGQTYEYQNKDFPMVPEGSAIPTESTSRIFSIQNNLKLSYTRVIGIQLIDRGPYASQLMNYELHLSPDDTN